MEIARRWRRTFKCLSLKKYFIYSNIIFILNGDMLLINFECIFIKIAKMPCSQIESVKMIMLQVASNHFSISKRPIFAPHIFLFPIKQSCRANNDQNP